MRPIEVTTEELGRDLIVVLTIGNSKRHIALTHDEAHKLAADLSAVMASLTEEDNA